MNFKNILRTDLWPNIVTIPWYFHSNGSLSLSFVVVDHWFPMDQASLRLTGSGLKNFETSDFSVLLYAQGTSDSVQCLPECVQSITQLEAQSPC
jgi:hypothetical protein